MGRPGTNGVAGARCARDAGPGSATATEPFGARRHGIRGLPLRHINPSTEDAGRAVASVTCVAGFRISGWLDDGRRELTECEDLGPSAASMTPRARTPKGIDHGLCHLRA
jgi:hypothetical protein